MIWKTVVNCQRCGRKIIIANKETGGVVSLDVLAPTFNLLAYTGIEFIVEANMTAFVDHDSICSKKENGGSK